MKFFTDHCNKETLFSAPHKWLLAAMLCPVHTGQWWYHKRYHMRYAHAKKVFTFDLFLLASIAVLTVFTLSWLFYDPTVRNQVVVDVEFRQNDGVERIVSGADATILVNYTNTSDTTLTDATLTLRPPATALFSADQKLSIPVGPLPPTAKGSSAFPLVFFGEPGIGYHFLVQLSYRQADRTVFEDAIGAVIVTPRDSVLTATTTIPSIILGSGETSITFTITHTGTQNLFDISVPLNEQVQTIADTPTVGSIRDGVWMIDNMAPGQTATLSGRAITNFDASIEEAKIGYDAFITVAGQPIRQTSSKQTVTVVHPRADLSFAWNDANATLSPGGSQTIRVTIQNTGKTQLANMALLFPTYQYLNTQAFLKKNNGKEVGGGMLRIPIGDNPMDPGDIREYSIVIPIVQKPTGQAPMRFVLSPTLTATVPAIPDARYTRSAHIPDRTIHSYITLSSHARYYAKSGDQLGRGPLPPIVGEETKYWIFADITNGPHEASGVSLHMSLPNGVFPTGKSSVSKGQAPVCGAQTHACTWQTSRLLPLEHAGVFVEVSITPNVQDIGKTPILVSGTTITATDEETGTSITASVGSLNTAIPFDKKGSAKGGMVEL